MTARNELLEKLKTFVTEIEKDEEGYPWAFLPFENFMKELRELQDIVKVDATAHAAKKMKTSVHSIVEDIRHEIKEVVEESKLVTEHVAEVAEEVKSELQKVEETVQPRREKGSRKSSGNNKNE